MGEKKATKDVPKLPYARRIMPVSQQEAYDKNYLYTFASPGAELTCLFSGVARIRCELRGGAPNVEKII